MRIITIVSFFVVILFSCEQGNDQKQNEKNCFPGKPVAKTVILVADTSILGHNFIPNNDTVKTSPIFNGVGFVKLNGSPTHQPLKTVILSESQQKAFLKILRPLPAREDGTTTSCIPIFRHVALFYDKAEKLLGQMQICFDCNQVNFNPEPACLNDFDNHRLPELKSFFKAISIPMFNEN